LDSNAHRHDSLTIPHRGDHVPYAVHSSTPLSHLERNFYPYYSEIKRGAVTIAVFAFWRRRRPRSATAKQSCLRGNLINLWQAFNFIDQDIDAGFLTVLSKPVFLMGADKAEEFHTLNAVESLFNNQL
jgi:hypothetical protein